jgi:hypothetical protein
MEVGPGHTVLPVGMGDGAATRKLREHHVIIILHQEPCFLPPDQRVGLRNG